MSNKPLVSIIIPVYNGSNYLKEAIDSALNQTYQNIEVIVVNDGSIDDTEKICKKYGKKIRYFFKTNGGVSSALNLAIDNMKGEYFSWLSHDDLYLPNKIEFQMTEILKQKNIKTILYCDYNCVNSKGTEYLNIILDHKELKLKPEYAFLRGSINGITMFIPKNAFDVCGKFDESLKCTQDYDLWWRMFNKGYIFVHLPKILTKTRIHFLQDSQKNPAVITEGKKLWFNMIEGVIDSRKIELSGSLYNYYYEMAQFLATTPYKENFEHCVKKCLDLDRDKYIKFPVVINKNKITRLIYYIKNQGFTNTIKIIINRIFKRK